MSTAIVEASTNAASEISREICQTLCGIQKRRAIPAYIKDLKYAYTRNPTAKLGDERAAHSGDRSLLRSAAN